MRNHLCNKDPGDARHVPGASWDPGDPLGTLLGLRGRAWDLRARPWDPPGTSLRPPRHALGTPGEVPETPQGRPWDPWGPLGTPVGPLMDNEDDHISTNIQRQKLSIAVFEAAHEGPSHEQLDRAVFLIKDRPNQKNYLPVPGFR